MEGYDEFYICILSSAGTWNQPYSVYISIQLQLIKGCKMYIVTNKLTQKQTNIWHNSSSINIKIITTLQIYIINKHVKLDKSNKDESCNRTLSFNHDCRKGTCLWHKCVSVHKFFVMSRWQFYFFPKFFVEFLLPEQ